MHLISAELVHGKKVQTCTCCMGAIPRAEQHWVEVWNERGRIVRERFHVRCPGETETRKEYRDGFVEHLANDPG